MVSKKTEQELELMRKSGRISAKALKASFDAAKIGVSGLELDKIAEKIIYEEGGDLSYKTVPGYKWATCVTFNEGVVHGIPTDRKIEDGDLVSVDLAATFDGWHTDNAWTILVGKDDENNSKVSFLAVGEEALFLGIKQAVSGNTVGDISSAIQEKVEGAGFHVVKALVGHGVGKKLHEDPQVPGFGKKGTGLRLEKGMTLAIEVIYAQGTSDVEIDKDGWTYVSADGSLTGLFEMSVVVSEKEAEILTDWRKV